MNMFLAKLDMFMANFAMLLTTGAEKEDNVLPDWLDTLIDAVQKVIGPILIVAATAGVIYSVWVGIKFVKADTKDEREEAKQKLIYVIVGVVVTLILIVAFYWLAHAIEVGDIQLNFWKNDK